MADKVNLPPALDAALRPFILAAAVGSMVADEVNEAKPRQHSARPLIAFGSYAGQYAAESRVSFADWLNLLDAAYNNGLLDQEGQANG